MFYQLLKFDLLGLRRDGVALVVLATLLVACSLALVNGKAVIADRDQSLGSFVETVEASQAALPTPVSPNAVRRTVALPAGDLAGLSLGRTRLDPWYGSISYSTLDARLFANYQTASPLALQAGGFDLGFVVTVIVPLLIIALGYGVLTAERDSGRLRAVLSHPVGSAQLLVQRLVSRMLLVGLPVTAFIIAGAVWMRPAGELQAGSVALWLAVAWISMLFWWALVGFANTLKIRAEAAAMGLISLWAVMVLVVPALIAAFATAIYPPPSRQALTVDIRQQEVIARESASDDLRRLMHDHPELLQPGGANIAEWMKAAVLQRQTIEAHMKEPIAAFEQQLADQRKIAQIADFLSPALGLSHALSALSGTDQARHEEFRQQALAYKGRVQDQLAPNMLAGRAMSAEDVNALESFEFVERPSQYALAVALFWAILAAIAGVATLKYSRRVSPI